MSLWRRTQGREAAASIRRARCRGRGRRCLCPFACRSGCPACRLPRERQGRAVGACWPCRGSRPRRWKSWPDVTARGCRGARRGSPLTETAAEAPRRAEPHRRWRDMAWTAGVGRSHFSYRAGLVFGDVAELQSKLAGLAAGDGPSAARPGPAVAFVFAGQGSQRAGMGLELYESEPVARAVLERCERVMLELRGASLLDVMFGRPGAAGDLDDTVWTQPALYALESALVELWASVGVRPEAVLGHSVGEIAAARAAGVLGLEDGLRFAAARGELMGGLPAEGAGAGAMLAVFAPAERVVEAAEEAGAGADGVGLSVAADNGTHRVVSGPAALVEAVAERFGAEGVRVERLRTSHAFHSGLMDPVLDGLEAALEGVSVAAPAVALVSNVTGRAVQSGELLDGAYWRRQAREPVAFAAGVATLAGMGIDAVVEIGPRLVLGPIVEMTWPAPTGGSEPPATDAVGAVVLSNPRLSGSHEAAAAAGAELSSLNGFLATVAAAYGAGVDLSFEGLYAGEKRRRVSLPAYPFQRRRFWVDPPKRRRRGQGHPLLGTRRDSAGGEVTFETEMSALDPEWLSDHKVFGRVVAPGALYVTLVTTAGKLTVGADPVVVEDLQVVAPMVFEELGEGAEAGDMGRTVQVVVGRVEGDSPRIVQVFSKGTKEQAWMLHAEGRLPAGVAAANIAERTDLEELRAGMFAAHPSEFYQAVAAAGINLGPTFTGMEAVWKGAGRGCWGGGAGKRPAGHAGKRPDRSPGIAGRLLPDPGGIAGRDRAQQRRNLPSDWD